MRTVALLLALAALSHAERIADSGYLLTAPKVLQAGTSERACLTLHHLAGPGRRIRLSFYEKNVPSSQRDVLQKSDFLLFETEAEIPDAVAESGEYCFDIAVPAAVTTRSAEVEMELSSPEFSFPEKSEVTIYPEAMLTLVQTDKAKYQPGQKVLFRIITLSHDLTALNDDLEEVWVTTPKRTRLAQWKDVKADTGMVQLEFQLTEETPLGTWRIHAKTPQGVVTKSFSVEEYVLPTFEVTVDAPKRIDSSARTVTATICAKYTFGKPLIRANVSVNATADISDYYYRNNKDLLRRISDHQLSDEEGCATFDLVVSKLGIGNSRFGSSNSVTLKVVVEEEGTGLTQEETARVSQSYRSISLAEGQGSQHFLKPGLPFYGQYTLKRDDDSPAAGEIVRVCSRGTYKDRAQGIDEPSTPDDYLYRAYQKYSDAVETAFGYIPIIWETKNAPTRQTGRDCREYRTDENGRIVYFIPPQAEDIDSMSIDINSAVEGDSTSSYKNIRTFFSPSRSYLAIGAHELPDVLPCSGDVSVGIMTSQPNGTDAPENMIYKILSRGRIIKVGQTGSNLTFPVLPKMAPEFKLLVYFVLPSGEVVSDSRVMKVKNCFPNQVQVNWDKETVKPGDSASFTVRAAPNSVCGISAVDRSTELLGTENQITIDTVFNQLNQFVISRHQNPNQVKSDDEYCKDLQIEVVRALRSGGATSEELSPPQQQPPSDGGFQAGHSSSFRPRPPPPFPEPRFRTDRDDALKAFDEAGFLVMSNLGLESRQCYKRVPAVEIPEEETRPETVLHINTLSDVSASRGPSAFSSAIRGGIGARPPPAAAPPRPVAQKLAASADTADQAGPDQLRQNFPEAFLFSLETVAADGVKTVTSDMPDTITSWVGSAVCTNSKDGFGLSNKTSITTFKPFFTEMTLPYSLKRGEVLNMSASVFNFLDSSLSVYLELASSDGYALADESSPAGYDLCIEPGRTVVKYFPMTFSDLGDVNVTVSARAQDGNCPESNAVAPGSDTVVRPIVIKPEGFPQVETFSRFICLDKDDDNHEETVEFPVRDGLVEDSERAYFSVIGDLLGPTYNNLESGLISSPTGGGEPNLITLVPNIHIRRYLERTGQATERQRRQTDNNMKSGYQRELRYRRYDGSYSSYGDEDPEGSVFLTAFVVQALKEASEFLDVIDEKSLDESANWVLRNQMPNGCFQRVGELIHKEMKGGVERGGEAALTAFVMLALKDVASSDALAGGFACLEDGLLLPNKTLYSEILMAYTYLSFGQEVKGARLIEKLMSRAQREGDDILYWEGDRSSAVGGSKAVDVEMTAYMVLSLLQLSGKGYLEEAARAVRWLNTQRSDQGGFQTTQDTIAAVRALTAFAEKTFASDLSTSVTVAAPSGQQEQLTVDGDNRLLLQQSKIPDLQLPGEVKFEVSPPGCVVLQTIFKYSSNVEVPDPGFSLGVASEKRGSSSYELRVCTSYLRLARAPSANRVILDVELPSGYIPVDSTLRDLRQKGLVRKYKASGDSVVFTLQGVSEEKTCLPMRIIQESEVENLKPAVAHVYDFYRPEDKNLLEYELTTAEAA